MKYAIVCFALALAAMPCFGQSEEKKASDDIHYFRLDFVIKEIEAGKVVTARNYTTTVSNRVSENSSIRTGDKVPITTSPSGQYTFFDVGVNIDSRVLRVLDERLVLFVSADITSVVTTSGAGASLPPVVRQNRWSANAVVPLKKATTIFSADGASEKRQMQLEVTATPIL